VVNHGHVGDGLGKKAPMYFSLHLRPYIFISRAAKVRKKRFLHMLLRHVKKHKANKRLRVFEKYPNVKLRSNKCFKTHYLLTIFGDGGLGVAKLIYIFSCRLGKKRNMVIEHRLKGDPRLSRLGNKLVFCSSTYFLIRNDRRKAPFVKEQPFTPLAKAWRVLTFSKASCGPGQ